MASVVVVSDTHLSPRTPEADANWDAVVAQVRRDRPDLVLHLGDLTLDGAAGPEDLQHARARLDELAVPWMAVPGNHDIGDNPSPDTHGHSVDAAARQRWLDAIGDDWWWRDLGGWRIVALDAQLFGSGLAAEDEQWRWLAGTLTATDPAQPVVLALHKPLTEAPAEAPDAPSYRYVPPAARARLDALTGGLAVRMVLSGHVHQYLTGVTGGRQEVWAPTTWAVVPDDRQRRLGDKRCGIVALSLGDGEPQVRFVTPPALAQHTIGEDIANPYGT